MFRQTVMSPPPSFPVRAIKAERTWVAEQVDQDILQTAGRIVHVSKNLKIFDEGDEPVAFYEVLSGFVRVCRSLSCGRRQIDAFHAVGDVFGMEQGYIHGLSADAVSDCTLRFYSWRRVEMLALNNKDVARQLLHYAMQNLTRARDHSLLLAHRRATERVAAFLLDRAKFATNKQVLDLAMSRQDIADYLGLTIEAVSRTLCQFNRDNVIAIVSFRKICLKNLKALEKFAD